jgi:hypothetical protein
MPVAAAQSAKRALVKVLLVLAVFYAVRLEVSRESPDQEVTQVYRHGKTNPFAGDATIRGADGATNDVFKILFFDLLSPTPLQIENSEKVRTAATIVLTIHSADTRRPRLAPPPPLPP